MKRQREVHDVENKSAKAQRASNLGGKKKLHVTTSVASTGLGEIAAGKANRVLGQGKREIWQGVQAPSTTQQTTAAVDEDEVDVADPKAPLSKGQKKRLQQKRAKARQAAAAALENTTAEGSTDMAVNAAGASPSPMAEELRVRQMKLLQKGFLQSCTHHPPPVMTFERWLLGNIPRVPKAAAARDPLLPAGTAKSEYEKSADQFLLADLSRGSMPRPQALQVLQQLRQASNDASSSLRASVQPTGDWIVDAVCHKHSWDVKLMEGGVEKRLLKLNHEHYDKLFALWNHAKKQSAQQTAPSP